MKISLIHTRTMYVLLLSCTIVIVAFVGTVLIQPLFIVDHYTCIAHGVSLDYTERIQQSVRACMSVQKLNSISTIAYIKKEFPAIDTVLFRFYPDHISIAITPYAPLCVINNEKVITRNGILLEKLFFDDAQCISVPQIIIPENVNQFVSFMPRLVQSLGNYFSFFNPVVIASHRIYLEDKDEEKFAVITTVNTYISEKMVRYCQQIKQQLHDRGVFKKNERWLADIRFADHIIVYRG